MALGTRERRANVVREGGKTLSEANLSLGAGATLAERPVEPAVDRFREGPHGCVIRLQAHADCAVLVRCVQQSSEIREVTVAGPVSRNQPHEQGHDNREDSEREDKGRVHVMPPFSPIGGVRRGLRAQPR